MGILRELTQALGTGERIAFHIERQGNDRVTILVQPLLAQGVEDTDADTAQMRAALAMPLRLTGPITDLDARLPDVLREFGSRRQTVHTALSALDALREAGKAGARLTEVAQGHAAPKADPKPAADEATTSAAPGPAPQVPATNPGSLF
jgi:PRTRC genetic system protein E